MLNYLKSLNLLSFDLTESEFKYFDIEQAKEGGSLDFGISVDLSESLPKVQAPFEIEFVFEMNGYNKLEDESRKKLFDLKHKYSANFYPLDSNLFFAADEDAQLQFCLNLLYPYIRESVLQNLKVAGLGIIELPLTFIDTAEKELNTAD